MAACRIVHIVLIQLENKVDVMKLDCEVFHFSAPDNYMATTLDDDYITCGGVVQNCSTFPSS